MGDPRAIVNRSQGGPEGQPKVGFGSDHLSSLDSSKTQLGLPVCLEFKKKQDAYPSREGLHVCAGDQGAYPDL